MENSLCIDLYQKNKLLSISCDLSEVLNLQCLNQSIGTLQIDAGTCHCEQHAGQMIAKDSKSVYNSTVQACNKKISSKKYVTSITKEKDEYPESLNPFSGDDDIKNKVHKLVRRNKLNTIRRRCCKNNRDYAEGLNPFREHYPEKLNPFREYPEELNPFRDDYPEELNPFRDDYPEELNPFRDDYPEELNPFRDDDDVEETKEGESYLKKDKFAIDTRASTRKHTSLMSFMKRIAKFLGFRRKAVYV